jgi:two-component system OmpR family sensor kinase
MTLRARILLVLVGVVAAGLVIVDVVTYTSLRSFLISRTQPQLEAAAGRASFTLLESNGYQPVRTFGVTHFPAPPPVSPSSASGVVTTQPGTVPAFPLTRSGTSRFEFLAPGTFGELIHPNGTVLAKTLFSLGGTNTAPPVLPNPLPKTGSSGQTTFTASSKGAHVVSYQILVRTLPGNHLTLVVGLPLTDVDQTLGRLRVVLLLVSLAVLIGLGALGWLIVRRGLRPLEAMAETAGEIAQGDLGRRVTPDDDRTEVGRLGQALNAMLGDIEEAFAARAASEDRLRQFLADASHELKTPLTSIRGHAELFEMGAKDRPEDLATSMRHIREEADRMNVMVNDLLLLARLDHERPIDFETTDIVSLVNKSITAARVRAQDRAVVLDAPSFADIECDAARLRQVLDNLLANAIRHSPPGTPVEIRVNVEDGVTVEVSDHGPGVDPDEAEHLFEPFYRSDFARARLSGGTGLGLAIVAAIVRAHHGQVGVRNNVGGGACFWFWLPTTHERRSEGDAHDAQEKGKQEPTVGSVAGAHDDELARDAAPGLDATDASLPV